MWVLARCRSSVKTTIWLFSSMLPSLPFIPITRAFWFLLNQAYPSSSMFLLMFFHLRFGFCHLLDDFDLGLREC